MGKMTRSYSIFVLFLLMSIFVFAKNGNGHGNGNKAWVENAELLEGNQIKINLKTRTKWEIDSLTIEEVVEKIDGTFLGWNKNKYIYSWSIICDLNSVLKPGDPSTISFKIKKNQPKDGTNSIGGKEISYDISDLVPPKEVKIEIKTYEEIYGWENGERTTIDDSGRTYIYTKGGDFFHTSKPIIYVEIPEENTDEKGKLKITKLKVEKLNSNGRVIGRKNFKITKNIRYREIELDFIKEEANIVRVTPIAADKYNIDKTPKILNFIVDTKINSSYLDDEDIIGELKTREISIKLSKFGELSGINKYSYTLSNGFQREGKERTVDGRKYLTPTQDGKLDDVKIQLGNFSEGSRLTLSFTVYDRLGHEKTYEKTYFMPKQSDGIAAKVSGEVKQRRSKIKIITEGNKEKFGIGSSIDGSSEEDEAGISGS